MLLVKNKDFELHTPVRLVKSSDVMAARQADEVIAMAEQEAARIREEAKKAFEEERRKGYDVGLEEGKAAIVARQLELKDESVRFMESVESKMVDVVMKVLRKCIGEVGDQELVIQMVRKVMNALVRNQRKITLKVAPEMVPVVKARLDEILADYPLLDEVEILDDARLKGAACMIETEVGIADASVETQLAAVETSLRRHFSKEG